ncbi:hypothetical protein QPK87_31570 [Kamptonema cortianum]|nr:hypothetical protein [Geitlerinema splendidum]MDK3161064.1 hypothetical protein [Kamptonema cortianum]
MPAESITSLDWRPRKPLVGFFAILAILFVLRTALGFVVVAPSVALFLSGLFTVVFIVLPIAGLFWAAAKEWKSREALLMLIIGAILHILCFVYLRQLKPEGAVEVLMKSVMQTGVLLWCFGLGASVSILIKEKSMVLPIAIFLAGMDAFLILTPTTIVSKIAAENPAIVGSLGYQVPMVKQSVPGVVVPVGSADLAYVGPADLFITAVFFTCLFRYRMRTKETALWLAPVLVAYLFLVFLLRFPLPALVPIGLTVLIVNAREFQLSREEKQATWFVTLIALGMASYGLWMRINHKPQGSQSELSIDAAAPQPPKPAGSIELSPADPNR